MASGFVCNWFFLLQKSSIFKSQPIFLHLQAAANALALKTLLQRLICPVLDAVGGTVCCLLSVKVLVGELDRTGSVLSACPVHSGMFFLWFVSGFWRFHPSQTLIMSSDGPRLLLELLGETHLSCLTPSLPPSLPRMLEDKFSPPALLPSATAWFRAVTIGTTAGCPLV